MNTFASVTLQEDEIDFEAYMQDTEVSHRVKAIEAWEDDINGEFVEGGRGSVGTMLPWLKVGNKIKFRPGEVSLWFGFNKHGKSLMLGQAMLSAAAQGERICVASFEMRPHKTLARMARQWCDSDSPLPSQVREFVRWGAGKLWMYDQTSTVQAERVYAVIRYAVDQLRITHFVVDNLTKCVASDDDYAGQKAIVDKLTSLAQSLGIHIHLVHHARKAADESKAPRKMDAMGASAITNLVDNIFIVWRNKAKADKPNSDQEPDAMLICDGQRHGTGWEGVLNLRYHSRSQQYIDTGYEALNLAAHPAGI
jgi:twinkle protein